MRLSLSPKLLIPIMTGIVGVSIIFFIAWPWAASPAAEQLRTAATNRTLSRNDQLIWDYQERARKDPKSAGARAVLGAAYIQKARETGDPSYYGKAEQVLNEALALDSKYLDALIGKGSLALSRHRFREALAIGEQARIINPHVPRVYGVIADAQIELGMYDQAVNTVQQMVDMRPDLSSYSRVSYLRELYGDLDGAIKAMERAVSAGGPSSENVEWTRVQLGNLAFTKGDLAEAERHYTTSLQRLPDYVYATAGMAHVRAAQGKTDQAILLYQHAIERIPLPEFVIALGELQESLGHTKEAEQQYQLVRAMQQLFTSNGVDTDLELALFESNHGRDPAAAVDLARAAYQRHPSIKGADVLGWALYRAGNYAEARRYADEALRLGTQDALMLYRAGMIAQAQGDTAAARDRLNQAIKLNPAFSPLYAPQARQALNQLNATAGR
ncbi:MAG: tetratricopeptide repeat protein [Roseiflexaceae bacterium]|nr:tetratricopeptide repeat protein [Roseiflexaceae bacterium]